MFKKKHVYKFNPHTLSYEKVVIGVKDHVKQISFGAAFGFVLGIVLLVIGLQLFDSPREKRLKSELHDYKRQMALLNKRMNLASQVLSDIEQRDANVYRTIFDVEPISDSVRNSGFRGVDHRKEFEGLDYGEVLESTTVKMDKLYKRLYVQSKSLDDIYEMARTKQERMASMPAIMPIAKNQCKVVSGFGYRYHPILHYRRMHTGIDLTARKGTPIYATGDGVVVAAGKNVEGLSGYGTVCVINHGYGMMTLYAHLNALKVRPGQKVKRGEMIADVGSTGLSQGYHLHYEVIQNGKKVNPVYYFFNDLSPEEYEEVIEAANQENQCLS